MKSMLYFTTNENIGELLALLRTAANGLAGRMSGAWTGISGLDRAL